MSVLFHTESNNGILGSSDTQNLLSCNVEQGCWAEFAVGKLDNSHIFFLIISYKFHLSKASLVIYLVH